MLSLAASVASSGRCLRRVAVADLYTCPHRGRRSASLGAGCPPYIAIHTHFLTAAEPHTRRSALPSGVKLSSKVRIDEVRSNFVAAERESQFWNLHKANSSLCHDEANETSASSTSTNQKRVALSVAVTNTVGERQVSLLYQYAI